MNHQIPENSQRLVGRLRAAAEVFEEAARLGVPVPSYVTVTDYESGGVFIPADEHEFAAWVDYTGAQVEHYQHDGQQWSRASHGFVGLQIEFAVRHDTEAVTR